MGQSGDPSRTATGKKGRKGGKTGGKLEKKEIGSEASSTILPANFDYKSTNVGER